MLEYVSKDCVRDSISHTWYSHIAPHITSSGGFPKVQSLWKKTVMVLIEQNLSIENLSTVSNGVKLTKNALPCELASAEYHTRSMKRKQSFIFS